MKTPNKKKKLLIFIFFLVAALLAIAAVKITKHKDAAPKYRTERASRGDIVITVTASGTINPVTTIEVGTQVSGTITQIFVDYNSAVRKGQLIALVDPASLEAQAEQSRATLDAAKANQEKAEASLLDAERAYERNKELFSRNLIARSDMEVSETNYRANLAALKAAKAQVIQSEASLKYTETNLGYSKIVSPVDGIVISRDVNVGQTVAASFSTPTLFTIAQDLTKMEINASVDEADIGQIKAGQEVEFTADAYPEDIFHGKVRQVRNAATTVSNVVTYDVVIQVDNPDLKLKPGMTANVSFIISENKNVLRVSESALTFTPSEISAGNKAKEKKDGVWVLQDKKPSRVAVTVGASDGTSTEIVSGAIKEGDLIITGYLAAAEKGTASNSSRSNQRGGMPPPMF
ncbi:MAG: efflux RND transporter periplasmic adaptor subunit [Candidatus Omnitrophota bacterium]